MWAVHRQTYGGDLGRSGKNCSGPCSSAAQDAKPPSEAAHALCPPLTGHAQCRIPIRNLVTEVSRLR